MVNAIYTGLPDDTMFNTGILVDYESGQNLISANKVATSNIDCCHRLSSYCVGTHSLQDIRLLNTTNNAFCVEYYLVKGTDEHIVDATIKSDGLGVQPLPGVNIEANTEVCYSDIAASTWTLYGCDGGSTSCDSSNAAVTITDIVIIGATCIYSTTVYVTATGEVVY